jgi:hypothetical protein
MPLIVTTKKKVKGSDNVFEATGNLVIENKDCGTAKVLVKDLGDNKAQLHVDNSVFTTVLNGQNVKAYKGNIIADYNGEELTPKSELEFRVFSFTY